MQWCGVRDSGEGVGGGRGVSGGGGGSGRWDVIGSEGGGGGGVGGGGGEYAACFGGRLFLSACRHMYTGGGLW